MLYIVPNNQFSRVYKQDQPDKNQLGIDPADLTPWLAGRSFDECWSQYDTDGYIIFEGVLPKTEVEQIRAALNPHLVKKGRNNFEGFKSNRVYALLEKSPEIFADLITHPLALAFAERELGHSCLLSALLAVNLLPNETVQDWHQDDGNITLPRPRPTFGVSAFWAIDPMTETNGATEIIPKSHKWETSEVAGTDFTDLFDTRERDPRKDPQPHPNAIKAIMPSGSLMLTKGNLVHRGGANLSTDSRLIVTPQYCVGWARQLENMVLTTPREVAAKLPKRAQELMGYSIHGSFMGYVNGEHPSKVLTQ